MERSGRSSRLNLGCTSNGRFFHLSFAAGAGEPAVAGPPPPPEAFLQIGSDQGLLKAPVRLTALTIAPGERMDVLVDFSHFSGRRLYLQNGAFPIQEFRVGAHAQAAYPASGDKNEQGVSGRVTPPEFAASGHDDESATHDSRLLRRVRRVPESNAARTRTITLNEFRGPAGNTLAMLINRKRWHDPVTERVLLDSTEIWEFVNLTEDTHPMHLHLVRFQILDRRPFDTFSYTMRGEKLFTGPAVPPPQNEAGWKDVVTCDPGVITRVIIRFEGFAGRYLYHCHILEHEANDMMRPYEVIPHSPAV